MTAKGHVLIALPFAIIGVERLGFSNFGEWLFVSTVITGALIPDIDEPGSYFGRRFWFLSWPIKILGAVFPLLKHRGVTHYFLVPAILMVMGVFFHNVWIAAFGFGWFLHTIGDLMTVGGIRGYFYPLWPGQKIVLLPDGMRFYTNGFTERILNTTLFVINGYLIFSYQ